MSPVHIDDRIYQEMLTARLERDKRRFKKPYKFHDDAARAEFVSLTEHFPSGLSRAQYRWVSRAQRRIAAAGYIIKPPRDWGRSKGGRSKSERKRAAAQQNGKLGGRPRKTQVNVVTSQHLVGFNPKRNTLPAKWVAA